MHKESEQHMDANVNPEVSPSTKKPGSSLRDRLITSAIGLAIFAVWLLFFNTIALNIVLALLSVLLVYEVLSASKCAGNIFLTVISFFYALLLPLLTYPSVGTDLPLLRGFLTFIYVVVLFLTLLSKHKEMSFTKLSFAAFTTIAIPNSLAYAMQLRESFPKDGLFLFLLAFAGAWLTDTCAYFVGTMLGKHKLCPEISPKKTVEGFFGGIFGNILLCMLMVFLYSLISGLKQEPISVVYWQVALFGVLSALASVAGDLSASLVKRQSNVKDYGTIMPGMGGGMDRFDSVLFVLPFTYFFLQVFPILTRV